MQPAQMLQRNAFRTAPLLVALFFFGLRPRPGSALFPYTTLFRSRYCFSQTTTLVISSPCAFVCFYMLNTILPYWASTRVLTAMTFPAFLKVCTVVYGSTRLMETASNEGSPVVG